MIADPLDREPRRDLVLTLLYVPGDRVERAHKAMASTADIVIVDLEDAVAPRAKSEARAAILGIVALHPGRAVQVRVNPTMTSWSTEDLAMVAELPQYVEVCLPKVESAADVSVAAAIAADRPMHCLIETAVGIEAIAEIAREPGVATISLGEGDLRSDLGVSDEAGLMWCRQRIVVAARAAGLPPPVMSAYTNVSDLDGLAESTRLGRRMGFLGRSAIHPRQLPVIELAFAPHDDEVARAREVIASMEGQLSAGEGTSVMADGSFLDVAMVEYARRVLMLAERAARHRD